MDARGGFQASLLSDKPSGRRKQWVRSRRASWLSFLIWRDTLKDAVKSAYEGLKAVIRQKWGKTAQGAIPAKAA
jgi:hypothetical protein